MDPIVHTGTPILYVGFSLLVTVLLALDFFLLKTKGGHKVPVREALSWAIIWFAAAMVFAAWYWWFVEGTHGREVANAKTVEYVTGYLLEKALATENVFVWVTIFSYFAVPPELQKRVLLYGVLGAIVMRAILIYLGILLVVKFEWMFYIFGLFLVGTGIKMLLVGNKTPDLVNNPAIRWLRNHMRITEAFHGERFFVVRGGLRYATPLFLVLVLVELSDLIFSVDSIPAIFAVTTDPFVVFTSNIFAILGLRAMYFLLADLADRFHLLSYGLALIVIFIGMKMLVMDLFKIPIPWMLGTILTLLVLSIFASLWRPKGKSVLGSKPA